MTIKQIIKQLEEMGLSVSFYQRMDPQGRKRGIRITSIDGTKYSGSSGNIIARELARTSLSAKQETQLKKIGVRVEALPESLSKKLHKAQRLRRTQMKKTGDLNIPKITTKNIRFTWQTYGESEAEKQITDYMRRILQLVPTWLWDEYVARVIKDTSTMSGQVPQVSDVLLTEWQNKTLSADIDKIGYYDSYEDLMILIYDIEMCWNTHMFNVVACLIRSSINILDKVQ